LSNYPKLKIDLNKITENSRTITQLFPGLEVVAVVKGCLADEKIVQAIWHSGIKSFGDSRVSNLERLRIQFLNIKLMLLRQPIQSEITRAVKVADCVVVSDVEVAKKICSQAIGLATQTKILLMVESGDRREGVPISKVLDWVGCLGSEERSRLIGLAMNSGCLMGKPPTISLIKNLASLRSKLSQLLGRETEVISVGNSALLSLPERKELAKFGNQVRIGEAILLGQDTIAYQPVVGTHQDAFLLEAEVIEVRDKHDDTQVVVALGKLDIGSGGVKPLVSGANVVGISSDHLVISFPKTSKVNCGSSIAFIPSYFALMGAMVSPYVSKVYLEN
jgi:predicted amino acid racemase